MRISEIFYSIQGEGIHQGVPMIFIRTQGCNLWHDYGGCRWCDTLYAQDPSGGEERTIADVLHRARHFPAQRVCLTGGEPVASPECAGLLATLRGTGYWTEVETNGSLPLDGLLHQADCWVMDVKCPSSGMQDHNHLANLALLRQADQVKLVVRDDADVEFAKRALAPHPTRAAIVFSPVSGEPGWSARLAEHVKSMPHARLSLQLHKYIWGEGAAGK